MSYRYILPNLLYFCRFVCTFINVKGVPNEKVFLRKVAAHFNVFMFNAIFRKREREREIEFVLVHCLFNYSFIFTEYLHERENIGQQMAQMSFKRFNRNFLQHI